MDTSLYTPQVRQFIKTRPWPKGLEWEVLETQDRLVLVFFRDNWITLERDAHWRAVAIVKEIMEKLRGDGIPITFERILPGEAGSSGG